MSALGQDAANQHHESRPVLVVLVHGGSHGSWCWEPVVSGLQDVGVEVQTVDLPLQTLSEDTQVVRTAVRAGTESGKAVVLVGHSYGGLVISAGGHEADHLVYVAAIVPEAGDTGASSVAGAGTPELAKCMGISDDGSSVVLNEHTAEAFYGRCTEDVARSAMGKLRPQGMGTMNEEIGEPAWNSVSASYVMTLHDRAINRPYQEAAVQRLGAAVALDSDHSPFYSATAELVDHLVLIADACGTGTEIPGAGGIDDLASA